MPFIYIIHTLIPIGYENPINENGKGIFVKSLSALLFDEIIMESR